MSPRQILTASLALLVALSGGLSTLAQKTKAPKKAGKSVFFAVLENGTEIEPIGYVEEGRFPNAEQTQDVPELLSGKAYTLVFGGSPDGSIKVTKKITGECSGERAEITVFPTKPKLKGFVMAVATSAPIGTKATGVRRLPTATERAAVEKLVRDELVKQKVGGDAIKKLQYHNLTAVDIDRDGKVEMIGSFWVAPKESERATLFFIAEKNAADSYELAYAEFNKYSPEEVMSGEVKDLDEGIYHTLLLDYFDINGNGVAEVFTTAQAFEGRNFGVYSRDGGKWSKTYSSYNYRCGY